MHRFAIRRLLLALAVACVAYGVAFASAATLSVTDRGLGAGSAVVGSCDTDGVTVGYTYVYTQGKGYTVQDVTVSGIATGAGACDNKGISVTLAKADDSVLATVTGNAGTTGSVTLAPTAGSVLASELQKDFVAIG